MSMLLTDLVNLVDCWVLIKCVWDLSCDHILVNHLKKYTENLILPSADIHSNGSDISTSRSHEQLLYVEKRACQIKQPNEHK